MNEDRLPELFLEAVELEEEGRRELIARLQLDEPELAVELERLLALESTRSPIDGSAIVDAGLDVRAAAVPSRVGPYRIVRELARGGMGRVFLAEQETPDFRRIVALKLIDRPLPDELAVRRFRDEVRILASLEHPGIVRFLDGGRSPEGIWFLAQEYVEGDDLISHAERRRLTVPERVKLFRAVLEAVEAAHSRGVVHRDLKPSNLLVGADGRPRLLDFGISKLVDPQADAGSAGTRTETRALTPAYASPEQLAGRPVTAASDLYSLGVLLYELLVGERPFDSVASSAHELERAVLERDPEPPSSAARRRAGTAATTEPKPAARSPRAARALGPDLDAICLKALRKQPGERYASAGDLADDLARYLDGRPVEARRGNRRYRAARWALRYRGRLTTAAALVVAGASLLVALRAPRAGVRAVTPQVFPFSHVRTIPIEKLRARFGAAPDDVTAGAALALGLVEVERLQEAQILVGRLRQIPGREDDPVIDYAEATIAQKRNEHQRALVLLTRARDAALEQRRGELLAQIRASRGYTLLVLGYATAARGEMTLAAADFERAGDQASLGRVLNDLAIFHLQRGDLAQCEATFEAALGAAERAGARLDIITFNLGLVQAQRGRPDLGAPRMQRGSDLLAQAGEEQRAAATNIDLSEVLRDLGRTAEADRLLKRATAVLAAAADASVRLGTALYYRARVDLASGRTVGVLAAIERIERIAETAGDTTTATLAHELRGRLAGLEGDAGAARRHFAEAHRLLTEIRELDHAAEVDLEWAETERAAGNPDEALRVLARAHPGQPPAPESPLGFFGEILRARVDTDGGDTGRARERLDGLGEDAARSPSLSRRLAFLSARAHVAAAEGRREAASADFEQAVTIARRLERKVDELALRLAVADLVERPSIRLRLTAEVDREASQLGLARRLHGSRARGIGQ